MIISLDKYKATGGGGEKPTEVLTRTITTNGSQTFNPQEGYVFSSAEITTDVHPTEALITTISENGSRHFDGEYNGADITADVHPTDKLVKTITSNGTTDLSGEWKDASITVSIPEEKPEESLDVTITSNGSFYYDPSPGSVFSTAAITTNIHPTENLIATINENGIRHFDGEYNGADITVNVETFTPTGNIDINANGSYDVANYATANVNVQVSAKNYSYFDGVIDTEGLRAIGWDDESIGMYRDNERHYALDNNDYIVSEENKALYGVIVNSADISNNKDNPNFKYCPFFDTSGIRFMSEMFKGCTSLISIPKIDTSTVTDMSSTFSLCSSLTTIPHINTSKVTNMYRMFNGCNSLTTIPLLNTSKVTDMRYMFNGCSWLTSIPLLDTTNVTNMDYIFSKCTSLTSIPQIDTSKLTSMYAMFDSCSSLSTIPPLDTSKVTDMDYMFNGCRSLTSIPLLDTTNVTSMGYIFSGCKSLKYLGGFKNLSISVTSYFLDQCPKLTVESLMNVINNLATVSGKTLSFGSANLNKLTSEQKAIATNKGWTLT